MAMSGDMKISPEVFSLSTIRKPSDSWLCPAMSPNPAAGLCSSSFTSIFRMTARSGGCSFTRFSNSSRTEGTPSALISTKLPRLATVPRIPSAWAWRSTAGRKPTPWTIPYTLICLLSVFSIPVPVHPSFLLHVGSPIPACFVQPFLFQTDHQPLVRSLRSDRRSRWNNFRRLPRSSRRRQTAAGERMSLHTPGSVSPSHGLQSSCPAQASEPAV